MIQEQWLKYGRNFEKGRDSDFGQLRYAMRSVLVNAPYVRNFIIVVNSKESQTPSWLNATHPRIRIVEHKEIWDDPSTLPSFSSHQIEWNLMNIPNLAPLFLYLNDDFAIQTPLELPLIWPGPGQHVLYEAWEAPTASEVLRTPGMDTYGKSLEPGQHVLHEAWEAPHASKVLRTPRVDKYGKPLTSGQLLLYEPFRTPHASEVLRTAGMDTYSKSLAFVRSLYDNKYGRIAQRKVASHVPLLFNRFIVKTIKSDWPKEYDAMYRVPFRTPHDLQFQFAYQQYIRQHFKFSVAPSDHVHFVSMWADPYENARTFSEIKLNPRLFMCLQDGFADRTPSQLAIRQVHEFYNTMFPTEGPWELNTDDYYSEMIR